MAHSLRTRIEALEAALEAAVERMSRPMTEIERAARLASLLAIGEPTVLRLTERARWLAEIA